MSADPSDVDRGGVQSPTERRLFIQRWHTSPTVEMLVHRDGVSRRQLPPARSSFVSTGYLEGRGCPCMASVPSMKPTLPGTRTPRWSDHYPADSGYGTRGDAAGTGSLSTMPRLTSSVGGEKNMDWDGRRKEKRGTVYRWTTTLPPPVGIIGSAASGSPDRLS